MYIVNSLEYVIDRLFRCGVGDPGYKEQEVKELLQGMDYDSLLQAVRHSCLTPIQRRRLWLSCVCGMTVRQISQTENANFQNVAKSIAAAKKNLKKILTE